MKTVIFYLRIFVKLFFGKRIFNFASSSPTAHFAQTQKSQVITTGHSHCGAGVVFFLLSGLSKANNYQKFLSRSFTGENTFPHQIIAELLCNQIDSHLIFANTRESFITNAKHLLTNKKPIVILTLELTKDTSLWKKMTLFPSKLHWSLILAEETDHFHIFDPNPIPEKGLLPDPSHVGLFLIKKEQLLEKLQFFPIFGTIMIAPEIKLKTTP